MKYPPLALCVAASMYAGTISSYGAIALDGIFTLGDSYSNSEVISFYNSEPGSIYGSQNNQLGSTTIYYETTTLLGDNSGTNYFFVFVEAPLQAKNMIWSSTGLPQEDRDSYGIPPNANINLDYTRATNSEELILDNGLMFSIQDVGMGDDDNPMWTTSLQWLLSQNLIDINNPDLSDSSSISDIARNTTMSFEFKFDSEEEGMDFVNNMVEHGVEFHLSPERNFVVPEPNTVALGAVGLLMILRRRNRY